MAEWWEQLLEQPWLRYEFYDNPVSQWIIAGVVWLAALLVVKLVNAVIRSRARSVADRIKAAWAEATADLLAGTRFWFLLLLALYLGTLVLVLPERVRTIAQSVVVIALVVQGAIWGSVLIAFWLNRFAKTRLETDAASVTTMTALGFIGRLALWIFAGLLILDNLGIEVTALIAGLGIGGIAVALAAQNVLGDLFASLAIVLDKPFVLGDFIIVGEFMGTVEKIGIKTTRIRSLSGEQVIFSNSDLLKSRVRNFKRMYQRRIVFSVGVTYQTPYDKVAAIPQMIEQAVKEQEQTRFDRSHFQTYGDSALVFETVYYVLVADYNTYMNIQQAINLAIFKRFSEEGIEFAYPTQTLYVHREEPVPVKTV
jgi:small-conductance mechanosensitive channel